MMAGLTLWMSLTPEWISGVLCLRTVLMYHSISPAVGSIGGCCVSINSRSRCATWQ
jgi:hypothetical protein